MTKAEDIAKWRKWMGEEFSEAELEDFFAEHPEAAEDPEAWIELFRKAREQIPDMSPNFTQGVLSRIKKVNSATVLPLRRKVWRRWALASGLAAAAALSLVWYRSDRLDLRFPGTQIQQAAGPNGETVYFVRFAIERKGAKEVALAGDFNQWTPVSLVPSSKQEGLFTVELPLSAGIYAYSFVVDGKQWVADESANRLVDDGFGERNSVLQL